ncbi:unnamed protein product [Soboliphyme baturini]|uniref:WD_REPEATS_REGION domain-containing protein n=1 Tax=Soboliphyme baturini TaxID=241478 RepID=A0A183IZE9_9BILA|nr:unnamed protein product [Soboliphyme baturini]
MCFDYRSLSGTSQPVPRSLLLKKASFRFDEGFGQHKISEAWSVAFAPDDSFVAWSCGSRYIAVVPWRRAEKEWVFSRKVPSFLTGQKLIDVGYATWSVAIGYAASAEGLLPIGIRRRRRDRCQSGNMILAAGLENGNIRIYNVSSGELLIELLDHSDSIRGLSFSPGNCSILLSCSRDSTLKLWDMADQGNMFQTLKGHVQHTEVLCCAWSHSGKYIASGGTDKQLIIWTDENWTSTTRLNGHQHWVTGCEFSADDGFLASCSYDTSLVLWDYVSGEQLVVFWHEVPRPRTIFGYSVNDHYVKQCSTSPDCEHVATVCDDRLLRVWNTYCPEEPVISLEVENAVSVSFSNDGLFLAV